jgi:hypothetical protein
MSYIVRVYDNFHYMDESEAYERPPFETAEAALEYCRRRVELCLEEALEQGVRPEDIYQQYMMFGDDPMLIAVDNPPVEFSGWGYARQRCAEILAAARAASE